MRDTSRPHPAPSSRSAPYRNRKSSSNATSPSRATRRPFDASQSQRAPGHTPETIPTSNRAPISHRDEGRPSRPALDPCSGNERRTFSKAGGDRAISHNRRNTGTDGPARERPSHASALSTRVDVPGLSLRLPLTSAPPITNAFAGRSKAESPLPSSASAFLRSIELPDKPASTFPLQKSSSNVPPSLRLLPLSTDANKTVCTNGNGHQVSLVYKGYPFTYDLSALPDDPRGTIALLSITKSDPGSYFLLAAHYRRTGRSRAARAVIKSLLDNLDAPSDVEKGKGDVSVPASATSTATLVSPGSPCPKPIDCSAPVFKSAAMRPAMLLLAACELDISREHPDDPESAIHASTAHELFRAVYGTVNDAIVAGAVRPELKNALGLDFSSNRNCLLTSLPASNSHSPSSAQPPPEIQTSARVKDLEKELDAARDTQKNLQEKLEASNERLAQAEDNVRALESRSRDVLVQLDASRDENWVLRQQLVECERGERESIQCVPTTESRVWGRLKDLLF